MLKHRSIFPFWEYDACAGLSTASLLLFSGNTFPGLYSGVILDRRQFCTDAELYQNYDQVSLFLFSIYCSLVYPWKQLGETERR